MKLFVLKDENFVETDSLYLHDAAILVDDAQKQVYYWEGEKTPPKAREQGRARFAAIKARDQFQSFEFSEAAENPTFELNRAVNKLLGDNVELAKEKEVRTHATMAAISLAAVGVVFTTLSLVNGIFGLGVTRSGPYLQVPVEVFDRTFHYGRLFTTLSFFCFVATFGIGVYLKHKWLMAVSALSLGATVGWYIYLGFDLYLFEFMNEDPFAPTLLLNYGDLAFHVFLNVVVFVFVNGPLSYVIYQLFTSTVVKEREEKGRIFDPDRFRQNVADLKKKLTRHVHHRYGQPEIVDLRKNAE